MLNARTTAALTLAALIVVMFTACSSEAPDAADQSGTPTIVPTATPTSSVIQTSLPPILTSTPQLSTLVWWPAALYPDVKSDAYRILSAQLDAYTKSAGQPVTVRIKRNDGLGSIYATLLSGSIVAPSDMPDLALMRRSDLAQAVTAKLIEQNDTSTLTTTDFYPSGLALGQVNGVQYGIPYVLEVQQTIYRTTALPTPPHTLDDLIASGQNLLFPAGVTKGVNSTLLQQYIAAGGRIADDKGIPTLDVDPLRTVLHFYEQASFAGPQLLEYTSAAQYWPIFLSGKANFAQVDSTTYLAQRANLTNVATMPILLPAAAQPISAVDGWLWVITTPDADRQAQALNLLTWLVRSDQQAAFTKAMGVLPSQRSALAAWGNDGYTTFAGSLLDQNMVPPQDMIDPDIETALQNAFSDVLNHLKTADLAASDAQASVGK